MGAFDDGKIVGGKDVENLNDFKFQAKLYRSNQFICGACIISNNWVITAGHCVGTRRIQVYAINYGTLNLYDRSNMMSVQKIIVHPNFNSFNLDYDMALFQTRTNFNLNIGGIIEIPSPEYTLVPNTVMTVSGWGRLGEGLSLSQKLQMVEVPAYSQEKCRNSYPLETMTDRMVCAGYEEGLKDSCSGK